MPDNPNPHHRRSIRLPGFDYAQGGAYFVTICAWNRKCLFGRIVVGAQNAVPQLTPLGHIARQSWTKIPAHFPDVELDAFVVMPNHVHGIVVITDVVGTRKAVPQQVAHQRVERFGRPVPSSLSTLVRSYKSAVTHRLREADRGTACRAPTVWQRNYYERVIRNEEELNRIRQYIVDNPPHWERDRENPKAQVIEPEEPWQV